MDKFAENVYTLCKEVQPYTYVLAIVALLVVGVMFVLPSDEMREKGKKAIPYIIIGTIVILGAVYMGEWITGKIVF